MKLFIFIALNIRTTHFIFIFILTTFRSIYPSDFFRYFLSNSVAHTESWNEPFIWTPGVDCSSSVKHDWVQVLSYSKCFLLFLPVVRIEPATSRWSHSEALSSQTLYPLRHGSLSMVQMKGSIWDSMWAPGLIM